ncbi:MAG: hypothetical protein JNK40_07735 [Chromatiales bacterium]|nr:hypothetical protein [Chromatiales bacterium]
MSFVLPGLSRSSALALFVAASLAGVLLAGPAAAAKQTAPTLSGQKARVAQGGRVDLAASSLTAIDLAGLRPDFEKLKPRARSNAE